MMEGYTHMPRPVVAPYQNRTVDLKRDFISRKRSNFANVSFASSITPLRDPHGTQDTNSTLPELDSRIEARSQDLRSPGPDARRMFDVGKTAVFTKWNQKLQ